MKFEEIIDVKHWQIIQDAFSAIIGLPLKTIDQKGDMIVRPCAMPLICSEAVAASAPARKKCCQWYPDLGARLMPQSETRYQEKICPLGLVNFFFPVKFPETESIYLIAGPVVYEESRKDIHLTQRVQENGIDEFRFFECFNNLPLVTNAKLESVISLLDPVIAFMESLASFGTAAEQGELTFTREQVGLLLKTFLELALKLCDAERGSVMLFEKNSQQLSINEATGLSPDIIQNTKVKPGEGLAGLTIERKKALFLNDSLNDRELRLRMNKPKIKSAFVIPVFYKNDVLGVISVATAKQPNRFSDKLMELLNELVGMALEKITLK